MQARSNQGCFVIEQMLFLAYDFICRRVTIAIFIVNRKIFLESQFRAFYFLNRSNSCKKCQDGIGFESRWRVLRDCKQDWKLQRKNLASWRTAQQPSAVASFVQRHLEHSPRNDAHQRKSSSAESGWSIRLQISSLAYRLQCGI